MSEPNPQAPDRIPLRAKLLAAVEAALERNAQNPIALDVRGVTSFTDAFLLLTGGSDRQVRAIGDAIIDADRAHGDAPLGVEGLSEGHWVLIDCNDLVVHVFEQEVRELYSLERLWSDAEIIDLHELGVAKAALEDAQSDSATSSTAPLGETYAR